MFLIISYGGGPLRLIEKRKKLVKMIVETGNRKIHIILHTGSTNTRNPLELTRYAEGIVCDAAVAVAVSPYYLHHNK